MGNDKSERKMPRTITQRKKLSDITNTPILLKSRIYDENSQLSKPPPAQLQDELATLRKILAAKEEVIEENKRCMEKLWLNYCRKTKQNDDIISQNAQIYKDLMQAREKLKVLQHDNAQMSALYKAYKLEMQKRLDEALEQVDRLTKAVQATAHDKASSPKHSSTPLAQCEVMVENTVAITALRKRERKSYKESFVKEKIRQEPNSGSSTYTEKPAISSWSASHEAFQGHAMGELDLTATSICCDIEMGEANAVEKGAYATASQPNAGKGIVGKDVTVPILSTSFVSVRKTSERPVRRAVSSIGSYKEPPLNTKMRRAA